MKIWTVAGGVDTLPARSSAVATMLRRPSLGSKKSGSFRSIVEGNVHWPFGNALVPSSGIATVSPRNTKPAGNGKPKFGFAGLVILAYTRTIEFASARPWKVGCVLLVTLSLNVSGSS